VWRFEEALLADFARLLAKADPLTSGTCSGKKGVSGVAAQGVV
jgi:hypothetical protein